MAILDAESRPNFKLILSSPPSVPFRTKDAAKLDWDRFLKRAGCENSSPCLANLNTSTVLAIAHGIDATQYIDQVLLPVGIIIFI